MKLIKRLAILAVAIAACAPLASAKFLSVGPRVGILANELHFNSDVFKSDNRVGFTGGVQLEVMIPVVNLGFDVSAMYARRSSEFMQTVNDTRYSYKADRDYIAVPIDFKWKIGIPVISKFLQPYLFTGPEFAFRCSKDAAEDAFRSKKTDVSWNFGLGLEFFSHLQVGASYGVGMTKVAKTAGITAGEGGIVGRNRYWTMTAAWLF